MSGLRSPVGLRSHTATRNRTKGTPDLASPIRTVSVASSPYKPRTEHSAPALCRALMAAGCTVKLGPGMDSTKRRLGVGPRLHDLEGLVEADLVISLGGDGTLLALARHAGPVGTPLLGLDFGSFGFLARESYEVLMANLPDVLEGQYSVESRLMVEADVVRGSEVISTRYGLNDAVIAKTDVRHLVWLDTYVNDEHVATYPADGLIISTPTGSTAYALSAGGPIIAPTVESLLITPICPHSLYARPLIIEPSAEIKVNATQRGVPAGGLTVTLDGQEAIDLRAGDVVRVRRAGFDAKLVRISSAGFFERLRQKLRWGAER